MSRSMVHVSDLGRVVTGRTPPAIHPEYWGDELPFLTPSDMDGSRSVEQFERRLSSAGAAAMKSAVVPYGVGVSCIGWQMGKVVYIPSPVLTNQQINTIVFDRTVVDGLFLYYVMSSRREEIFRLGSSGSRTPILNKSSFEELTIELPPLHEQGAIARVLGALDDKIELNRCMNRTLEGLASALFRSWFVDFDPVQAKKEGRKPLGITEAALLLFPKHFENSELGPIPKGWRVLPLDSIAEFLNGLALQCFPPKDGQDLPVIKIAQLRGGTSTGAERASAAIPSEYVIHDGDIVFSWSGSLLVDVWCGGPGALNQHLFKVTSESYPKWFYFNWVKEHLPEFQAIAADKATTMGHIRRHHITDARVVVPQALLLSELSQLQEPLFARLVANRIENRTMAELRDTLLPALLSGEVTIKQAEEAVSEVA